VKLLRFALTRRWLGYLGLAIVFAIACAGLSKWQVDRTNEARAANELVSRNFNAKPVPLQDLLPTRTSYKADDDWKQVSLSGRYLLRDELLVRNRPFDGQPGFEVLVPLQLEDGSVFIVDRGYVPTGNTHDRPDSIPQPAASRVSVVVRLQQSEQLIGPSGISGEVESIHLPTVAKLVAKPTFTKAYGLLVSESPAAATAPIPQTAPVLNEGLHISYAIQWVLFGIMAFVALGYVIRTEYRIRNADDPEERERADERERRRLAKPRTDSEVEDELVQARR
jgi:cytochrome oxidase assembly protein ShyY1